MCKKYIASVLIPSLLINLYSCFGMREITKDELEELTGEGDLFILTKDSTSYTLKEFSYKISNETIYCWDGSIKRFKDFGFKKSSDLFIKIPSIERVNHYELNQVTTVMLVAGSFLILIGIAYTIYLYINLRNG